MNVVIGVGGSGSTTWPRAQLDNQSTYKPLYIATSESSLLSYVESAKGANPYLDNVLSALRAAQLPAVEGSRRSRSARPIVHKAYPSDPIDDAGEPHQRPAAATAPTRRTSRSIEACQYLGPLRRRSPTRPGRT